MTHKPIDFLKLQRSESRARMQRDWARLPFSGSSQTDPPRNASPAESARRLIRKHPYIVLGSAFAAGVGATARTRRRRGAQETRMGAAVAGRLYVYVRALTSISRAVVGASKLMTPRPAQPEGPAEAPDLG